MTSKSVALYLFTTFVATLSMSAPMRAAEPSSLAYANPICMSNPLTEAVGKALSCTLVEAKYYYYDSAANETEWAIDDVWAKLEGDCTVDVQKSGVISNYTLEASKSSPMKVTSNGGTYDTPFTAHFIFPTGCAIQLHGRHSEIGPDESVDFHIGPGQVAGSKTYFELNFHNGNVKRTKVEH